MKTTESDKMNGPFEPCGAIGRRSVAVAVATSLLALLLAGCATTPEPPPGPYVLQPLGPEGTRLPLATEMRISHEGVLAQIRSFSPRDRELWLRRKTGVDLDPLAAAPRGSRFVTLRLRLAATGSVPVHLETQTIRIRYDEDEPGIPPLDYTRVYELLRPDIESGGPDEAEVRRFMRGVLDGSVSVAPGEKVEGLLVFPEPPPPDEGVLLLEVPFLQAGSKTHPSRLRYTTLFLDDLVRAMDGSAPKPAETR